MSSKTLLYTSCKKVFKNHLPLLTLLILLMSVSLSARDFKGAEIQSHGWWTYGKFETRIYATTNSGVLSTFFLYNDAGWSCNSRWNELDVEIFGNDNATIWQSNPIWQFDACGENQMDEEHHEFDFSLAEGWHTYTMEWSPEAIKWYMDGKIFRTYTGEAVQQLTIGMQVMYNIWAHDDPAWVGDFDTESLPAYQFVDWLAVYPWVEGHTFGDEPIFKDDFKNLDNWKISTHTFDHNMVDFTYGNVGIVDYEYLGMTITRAGNEHVPNHAPASLRETALWKISPLSTSDYLMIQSESNENGEPITSETSSESDSQKWWFLYTNNGFYNIINTKTNKLLSLNEGATTNGTIINQGDLMNENQQFKIVWLEGTNQYIITPKATASISTYDVGVVTLSDAGLILQKYTGLETQKFTIEWLGEKPTTVPDPILVTPPDPESSATELSSFDHPATSSVVLDISSSSAPMSSEEISSSAPAPPGKNSTESSADTSPITSLGSQVSSITQTLNAVEFSFVSHNSESFILTLYSVDGSMKYSATLNSLTASQSASHTVSGLQSGAYVLKLTNTNGAQITTDMFVVKQ